MIKLYDKGIYLLNGKDIIEDNSDAKTILKNKFGIDESKINSAKENTMAYNILQAHNTSNNTSNLKIKFDAMASHDITYVGIVQTARASGLEKFPIPYVLTNCHNSLCAVGGTINEDDHIFGLSAAKKYGGIYVPAHQAVIHQYMREMMSGGGKMILGSDSHTRYGALGTMAIGEGGPELVKQLLCRTYDISAPDVVCVYLTGNVAKGVGPQDVALAIIGKVFNCGYVKNKVMEFVGDGIKNLNIEFRNGIDVMTTETTCLTSIWETDDKVAQYYDMHGRKDDFKQLNSGDVSYYDGCIFVDLSTIKPMIAMPFHPSNVYEIDELNNNLDDILNTVEMAANIQMVGKSSPLKLRDKVKDGFLQVEQGIIAGCAGGTFDNICDATDILNGKFIGADEFSLAVYPSSQPTYLNLVEVGAISKLMATGATIKTAFCGPCFGAGDVPSNNGLSIRHSTRNFPNREGSKPGDNQIASVALMDARSIAATAANKGRLISATEIDVDFTKPKYFFNQDIYKNRCYNGYNKPDENAELKFGPNIVDWPKMSRLLTNMLLKVSAFITDPVTTTDELIPSGETSSYRSNPLKLAEFTLSRKDPQYVSRAKEIQNVELARQKGEDIFNDNSQLKSVFEIIETKTNNKVELSETSIGSVVYAIKPGDGSAREQAASCQKVLGTLANIATEYATKRYRSNLINWGMLPFILDEKADFSLNDYIFVPDIKNAVAEKRDKIVAFVIKNNEIKEISLALKSLTDDEREIILEGCLMNYYQAENKN